MHVSSDRVFRFGVPPDELWSAMARTDGYQEWWPWLHRFAAEGLVTGDVWRCTVRPPVPYALRFTVTIDAAEPPRLVRATVDGDIRGTASLDVSARGEGSEARLVSVLSPSGIVLRAVSVAARPVVRHGHDWVLDTGLRQFSARAL